MDLWKQTLWYAVQTKPHRESLAATSLTQFNIDVFLPQIRQEQMICGVERLVTKPLFSGYLFAEFCPLSSYDKVRYAPGVLRVLGIGPFLIPLPAEVIVSIRARVHADGFVRLDRSPFKSGDTVIVNRGALGGWMGRVERELKGGKRVLLLLETIQQVRLVVEKRLLSLAERTV